MSEFDDNSNLPMVQGGGAVAAALSDREVQEVQAAFIIAKKFPRDQIKAADKIKIACAFPLLAESAEYAFKQGGSTITGPTIRLLEVCAQNWGNIDWGVKILSQTAEVTEVMSFCIDLETNSRRGIVFRVNHLLDKKSGPKVLTGEREIYAHVMSYSVRRMRTCMENIVPRHIIDMAREECVKTVEGLPDKKERTLKMIKAFAEVYKVTREDVERRLGKSISAMTTPEFVQLRRIFQSLQEKASKVDDWFEQVGDPEKLKKASAEAGNEILKPAPEMAAEKKAAIAAFEAKVAEVRAAGCERVEDVIGMTINEALLLPAPRLEAAIDMLNLWLKA